jgi:hypothetical protein
MKATRTTLGAGSAAKIADSGVNTTAVVLTALADLYLGGGSTLTSAGANSFGVIPANTPTAIPLTGELWGISAAGGAVSVLQSDG